MTYDDFTALKVRIDQQIAWVTLDHPPINLLDLQLILELDQLGRALTDDTEVRVVVLDSADPEFFSAHADVTLIKALPTDDTSLHTELELFHAMVDRFRTMPKATIAIIEGICRGGASELALSCDMRFAALDRAVFAQPEVSLGIIPGGSGTQRLPVLIGRSRALEVVLGCADIDAATAEQWGYVNRALPDGELRPFVEALATRIASYPTRPSPERKQPSTRRCPTPSAGSSFEAQQFRASLSDPETHPRLEAFMERGGQTRAAELQGLS